MNAYVSKYLRETSTTALLNRDLPLSKVQPAVSVFGLGYVGAVSMACFAKLGYEMIGVDVDDQKIEAINSGSSPIVEAQLTELLTAGVAYGRIAATKDFIQAVRDTDITLISVGTPTAEDGGCDTRYIRAAAQNIGKGLRLKDSYHLIVMRCSVPPGTTLELVVPEVERVSGKKLGKDFGLCYNPEFLREGTAVADFFDPPKTVIGASDERAAETLAELYGRVDDNILYTSIGAAEMVKYADNTWHAVKVTFANEIGRLCKSIEVDSHEVMNVFVQDQKLNLSPYYLKPGFAFGGSCLPKEVRAMQYLSDINGIDAPLVQSLMDSNRAQVQEAFDVIESLGIKRVGLLGVTFKADTDDLRESPVLDLMAMLMEHGYEVSAFDPNLVDHDFSSAAFDYMCRTYPAIAPVLKRLPEIMCGDIETLQRRSDGLVVTHNTAQFRRAVARRDEDTQVIDLVRLFPEPLEDQSYHGIAW